MAKTAKAFYGFSEFESVYRKASAFAGPNGRVATLPDIIAARLATPQDEVPWQRYFSTASAEYVGRSRGGSPIAIVAHGLGPLSTLEGITAAYGFGDARRDEEIRGGRISHQEFLRLESGECGDVSVVDLQATWGRVEYPFSGHAVTAEDIAAEPLWVARLGKDCAAYLDYHARFAAAWHKLTGHPDYQAPCILSMECDSNCSYGTRMMFDFHLDAAPGTAIAHLLSIGALMNSHHEYRGRNRVSRASDVSIHARGDGTRLVGIRPGRPIADIQDSER